MWAEGAKGVLTWGVKRSLLDYMASDADFSVEVAGGARFSREVGIEVPVVGVGGGLKLEGDVVLRAHGGALTVPIVAGELSTRALIVADPAAAGERLELVTVEPAQSGRPDERERRFRTRLAGAADALFLYNYVPRTAFDDLRVSLSS